MNEEEIKEFVKKEITNTYSEGKAKALQGLLDLYNKEREKNKKLLKEREDYAEEYIHNNPWLYKQLAESYIFKGDVKRKYISKDKIKQKIEELNRRYKEIESNYTEEELDDYNVGEDDYIMMKEVEGQMRILYEFLGE